ncbi:serine/threonine-protein kinase pim-3-like isoform X1 [Pseudorasbora parva]|uniref:serine/threonine-protein kinase pim-3-like isoform X1 n=1 Tax=Pseudorasbora parva TaxID=51549 RepID=UPI00351DED9E
MDQSLELLWDSINIVTSQYQRRRKEAKDSHSGQDREDQSEDVPPVESNDGQSSSQDSSGPPQVFHISEEPVTADPRGNQDWIDDSFNVFKRAITKLNGDSFPTPVHDAPDTSVDVTRASDGQSSSQDSSGPPQVFHISEEPVTADPRGDQDWIDDSFQTPVHDAPDTSVDVTTASDSLAEDQRTIMDIGSCRYEMGTALGEGGFGTVYAATRLKDGLQVAVKFASNREARYTRISGYSRPIPLEVALQMFANRGPSVPNIIQLLDWQDEPDQYFMVLERPMPCQTLDEFLTSYTGTNREDLVRLIMCQVTFAAQACCRRGVFHRDIKLENLLINPDTLEVKLIDFGCGDFLNSAGYISFSGTKEYCPPEYRISGHYHGEPATVWSLGVLLFIMLCWNFPRWRDLEEIDQNIWTRNGCSQECCDLIRCCLQVFPKKRIELEKVGLHDWFKIRSNKEEKQENRGGVAPRFPPGLPRNQRAC